MYQTAVLGTLLLILIASVFYVRLTWRREINPVPATWILLMVMISLSLWMYWDSPNKSLTANIGVTANIITIAVILTGVIATNIHYGTLKVAFDKVQKWCLAAGAGITVFWWITDQPLVSYLLLQGIAVAAYIATARRLWKAERTTEPVFFWIASLLSNLCAVYPAAVTSDVFAWIFVVRAVPSSTLMLLLIWRIKRKMRLVNRAPYSVT